jgi:hypothetical protein
LIFGAASAPNQVEDTKDQAKGENAQNNDDVLAESISHTAPELGQWEIPTYSASAKSSVPIVPVSPRLTKIDDHEVPGSMVSQEAIRVNQILSSQQTPDLKPRVSIGGPKGVSTVENTEDYRAEESDGVDGSVRVVGYFARVSGTVAYQMQVVDDKRSSIVGAAGILQQTRLSIGLQSVQRIADHG